MKTAQIQEIRASLLELHQMLMEFERRHHEKLAGQRIKPGELYNLITNHKSFSWLRSLSSLIVSLDEVIEDKKPVKEPKDLIRYIKKLLTPKEDGDDFSSKYYKALQSFPEALVAHGKVMKSIKNKPAKR